MQNTLLFTLYLSLAIEVPNEQGWPLAARNGPNVDNWLGKKGRRKITSSPCFFVPKRPKGRNLSEAAKGRSNINPLYTVD